MNTMGIAMTIKSTTGKPLACDALWNERQASFSLEQSAAQTKQDGLKAVNHQTISNEDDRKQAANGTFWYRVWVGCNVLLLMIILYAAYQFLVR